MNNLSSRDWHWFILLALFLLPRGWAADPAVPDSNRPVRIALVIGEQEYDAKDTLPAFAQAELARPFGFDCFTIQSDQTNSIPGLARLDQADLAVFYLRRRNLPPEQMAIVHRYLDSGKPLVALRTSSHSFQNWLAFDGLVLGGHYTGHYGNKSTRVKVLPEAARHPILTGVSPDEFVVASTLYRSSPLAKTATPLMSGRVDDRTRSEPVAWVNDYHGARVFYTSLGHPDDFKLEPFRRLLRNGILWALNRPIPAEPGPPASTKAGSN